MKNFLKESWEEYLGLFKKLRKNKKKLIIFIILFEALLFVLTTYVGIRVFEGW